MLVTNVCMSPTHTHTHTHTHIHTYIHAALAIGVSHAKVPYRHLKPENVLGLPPDVPLSNPSMFSHSQLQALYDNMTSIKFVGKLQLCFIIVKDISTGIQAMLHVWVIPCLNYTTASTGPCDAFTHCIQ